jgi:L-ascorbate metabolism protein UlaG (beta-lactamase superfamily)
VEIIWLGRNCFRIKGRDGAVITDPSPPSSGYRLARQTADIITLSLRDDPAYSYVEGIPPGARVLDAPGEYEVGGILVTGVGVKRPDGSRTVAFLIELDGIRVCHLGLMNSAPTASVLEELGKVDILLLPVGGLNALSSAAAQDVMTTVDPRVAIPMNYKTEAETMELDPLERFLKETGSKTEPQPRLNLTRSQLPSDLTLMVLEPRQ